MDNFVFSMDSHVVEPRTLWQENLPAQYRDRALRSERQDKYIVMIADNKQLHRMQLGDGNSADPRIGGNGPDAACEGRGEGRHRCRGADASRISAT